MPPTGEALATKDPTMKHQSIVGPMLTWSIFYFNSINVYKPVIVYYVNITSYRVSFETKPNIGMILTVNS